MSYLYFTIENEEIRNLIFPRSWALNDPNLVHFVSPNLLLRIYYPNFPVTTSITRSVEARCINKHEAAIA